MDKPSIHSTNIYSPNEASNLGLEQSKRAAEHSQFGIELDILGTTPAIKDYFAPLLPWEICAIQAQATSGKTMFANFWMRQIAEQLKREKRDEIMIYISLEESIEAQVFSEFGRILKQRPADFARGTFTDWARAMWAKSQIDTIPVWRIADSAATPEDAPELTLSNIYRAIKELIDGRITSEKWKPAVIFLDYLQVLPIDPEIKTERYDVQRRLQVARDVDRLRRMTTFLQCPIIINLQAKQELKGNNPPLMIPGLYDGSETMSIATRFDRMLSLWLPKTSYPVGTTHSNKDGINLTVKEEQAFIKVNKQRGGLPAGLIWELRVDYQTQTFYDAYYRGDK